jgi:adenylylsulfate kinase-like enzyme
LTGPCASIPIEGSPPIEGPIKAAATRPSAQENEEKTMSKKHPIVAVTGSSGAGTTTVKRAFEHIFYRDGIKAAVIEGDSFHRYDRVEMKAEMARCR